VDWPVTKELPCKCGGSNENCATCFGLGTYMPRSGSSFVGVKTHIKPKNSELVKRNVAEVFARLIASPISIEPRPKKARAGVPTKNAKRIPQSKRPAAPNDTVMCRHCNQRMRKGSLDNHYRRKHADVRGAHPLRAPRKEVGIPNESRNELSISFARQRAIDDGLIRPGFSSNFPTVGNDLGSTLENSSLEISLTIPPSGLTIEEARLQPFVRRVQGMTPILKVGSPSSVTNNSKQKSRRKASKAVEPDTSSRSVERGWFRATASRFEQSQDRREAHLQMGFPARENGRYGSHPLHDRFDDESSS
jgi:hypothetical protein